MVFPVIINACHTFLIKKLKRITVAVVMQLMRRFCPFYSLYNLYEKTYEIRFFFVRHLDLMYGNYDFAHFYVLFFFCFQFNFERNFFFFIYIFTLNNEMNETPKTEITETYRIWMYVNIVLYTYAWPDFHDDFVVVVVLRLSYTWVFIYLLNEFSHWTMNIQLFFIVLKWIVSCAHRQFKCRFFDVNMCFMFSCCFFFLLLLISVLQSLFSVFSSYYFLWFFFGFFFYHSCKALQLIHSVPFLWF